MSKLVYSEEYKELKKRLEALREETNNRTRKLADLKKEAVEAAGWTRCCRCFPRMVMDSGYCSCCEYNHDTKTRPERVPPREPESPSFSEDD